MIDSRYLCRGKRIDNGAWVEGYRCKKLICGSHGVKLVDAIQVIISCCEIQTIEVNPATVGRCTDLPDKNETRIFEGDIVDFLYSYASSCEKSAIYKTAIIKWDNNYGKFYIEISDNISRWQADFDYYKDMCSRIEIIGTIHDAPELLKGGADE